VRSRHALSVDGDVGREKSEWESTRNGQDRLQIRRGIHRDSTGRSASDPSTGSDIIRKAMPDAEEVISYQIPAYKLHGGCVVYFAGWKQHFSLYPAGEELREAFREELSPYEISKGTIRFPLSEAVPTKLIERIVKFRAQEIAHRAKSKTAANGKPATRRSVPKSKPTKGGMRTKSKAAAKTKR